LTDGTTTCIDKTDEALVSGHSWHANPGRYTTYAAARIGGRFVKMHRLILGDPVDLEIDHRDGNGLNNRRSNIRVATRSVNAANAKTYRSNNSGVRGVWFEQRTRRWAAMVSHQGVRHWVGRFGTLDEAADAWRAKAQELRGELSGQTVNETGMGGNPGHAKREEPTGRVLHMRGSASRGT
jgi:hypothetical protein